MKIKCVNEKMIWNTQDTNLSCYMPKANLGHTVLGQGTAISTLDHSATTPRAYLGAASVGSNYCFQEFGTCSD